MAQNYLTENKQLLLQYGPNSIIARSNPLSDSIEYWEFAKNTIIIPNNLKIIELFEKYINLLSAEEKKTFYKFKIHTLAFKNNQLVRLDSEAVPIFPQEFENMILKEN